MLVGVVGPDIPLLGCLGVDLPVLVCLEFDVSSLAFLKVLVHSDSPQPPIFSVRASAADVIMMVEGLSWVQVPRTFSGGPLDGCRGARLQAQVIFSSSGTNSDVNRSPSLPQSSMQEIGSGPYPMLLALSEQMP